MANIKHYTNVNADTNPAPISTTYQRYDSNKLPALFRLPDAKSTSGRLVGTMMAKCDTTELYSGGLVFLNSSGLNPTARLAYITLLSLSKGSDMIISNNINLCAAAGISKNSVNSAVDDLIAAGFVRRLTEQEIEEAMLNPTEARNAYIINIDIRPGANRSYAKTVQESCPEYAGYFKKPTY